MKPPDVGSADAFAETIVQLPQPSAPLAPLRALAVVCFESQSPSDLEMAMAVATRGLRVAQAAHMDALVATLYASSAFFADSPRSSSVASRSARGGRSVPAGWRA